MQLKKSEHENLKNIPIFLHLTKTAGGTLKTALAEIEDFSVGFIDGSTLLNEDAVNAENGIQLYYGHSIFGVHEDFDVNPSYYAFVRHPVRRVISHYYQLYNVDEGKVGQRIRESKDINDFFMNAKHWEFENFMSKIISGVGWRGGFEQSVIFERAKTNIDKYFQYIGFQEFFPESVATMADMLGCTVPVSQNINIGSYDTSKVHPERVF